MRLVGLGVGLAMLSLVQTASAHDGPTCAAAYEEAQVRRAGAELRGAREKLLVCVDDTCPNAIRSQCAVWLTEVEPAIPTVTFVVTDESGKEISDVVVTFDGATLKDGLDGTAVPVDPGKHTFIFSAGERAPIEQELVIREGEKSRIIKVSWKEDQTGPGGSGGGTGSGGSVHPAAWVVGGVGIVGMGLFATFGILGLNEKADASKDNGGCEPNCSDEVVDSIRTKFMVADISLGVGAAALVGAGIIAIVSVTSGSGTEQVSALPIVAAPLPGGALISAQGRF